MKLLFVNLGLEGKQILEATDEVVIEETEEEQNRQLGWGREGRQDSLAWSRPSSCRTGECLVPSH